MSERLHGEGLLQQLELDHPTIQPVLMAAAAALAVAAAWPSGRKLSTFTDLVRDIAGRLAFSGLSAAISAELLAGEGVLTLLRIETGAEALSEVEAVVAALILLVLTGPRRKQHA